MVKPQMMDEIEYNSAILLHEFPLSLRGKVDLHVRKKKVTRELQNAI